MHCQYIVICPLNLVYQLILLLEQRWNIRCAITNGVEWSKMFSLSLKRITIQTIKFDFNTSFPICWMSWSCIIFRCMLNFVYLLPYPDYLWYPAVYQTEFNNCLILVMLYHIFFLFQRGGYQSGAIPRLLLWPLPQRGTAPHLPEKGVPPAVAVLSGAPGWPVKFRLYCLDREGTRV